MPKRINRAIELLEQDQPIYYTGGHTGANLSFEGGEEMAGTYADYINVGMEHGSFDMPGLQRFMEGLVAGGPTRSGHGRRRWWSKSRSTARAATLFARTPGSFGRFWRAAFTTS